MFIIFHLQLTSHSRSTLFLLDADTLGTSKEDTEKRNKKKDHSRVLLEPF